MDRSDTKGHLATATEEDGTSTTTSTTTSSPSLIRFTEWDEEVQEMQPMAKKKKKKKKKKTKHKEKQENSSICDDEHDEIKEKKKKRKKRKAKKESSRSSEYETDRYEWWEPDLGPEPTFKLMGVAEYTLPEWVEAVAKNEAVFREFQHLLGPKIFVAIKNLSYNVTVKMPYFAMPFESRWKKIWTWCARVLQFQMGVPVNQLNRKPMQPLKDCTCYFKPGEMTLVLGAPGCGKEALFKILGNRTRDGKATGNILYNGKPIKPRHFHHLTSYIGRNDNGIHVANMTVRETLEFSHQSRMSDAELRPGRVDIILQVLKLDHRADTIVGDNITRGVSGGERRRVTIGVELVKLARVLYLDEPTTGLDASAALGVMRVLKAIATAGNTVVCCAKQPSYEILSLFDKVMIMAKGEIAFLGTVKEGISWFEEFGYSPIEKTNPAEFLQEVVETPMKFVQKRNDEESAGEPVKTHTVDEFIAEYKKSKYYQAVLDEIETQHALLEEQGGTAFDSADSSSEDKNEPEEQGMIDKADDPMAEPEIDLSDYLEKQKYPISILDQYWLLQKRELLASWRATTSNALRILRGLILAFLLCTLFFNLDHSTNDTYKRQGVVFFAVLYFAFGSFSTLGIAFQGRDIFRFQREYKYFRVLPYIFATAIADLPITIVDTSLMGTLVYWICGLNTDGADKYIYFMLLSYSIAVCMNQYARMCAYLSPNIFVANIIVPGILMVLLLYCGFFLPPDEMPYYFIWIYYISPLHYCIEGAFINEFTDYNIDCKPGDRVPDAATALLYNTTRICPQSSGNELLDRADYSTDEWVKWLMLVAVWGFGLIFLAAAYAALRWIKWTRPGDKYSPPLPSALEKPPSELKDLSTAYEKHRKVTNAFLLFRKKGGKPETQGAYFSFRDVNYWVPVGGGVLGSIPLINKLPFVNRKNLQLLDNLSGYVKPGMCLALMGASGAGKSTLLDVIGQRKTVGKIKGEMLINGHKVDKYFNRMVGYVEQADIHSIMATPREAIRFSAYCRLPSSLSRKEKREYAEQVIQFLGMQYIAGIPIAALPAEDVKLVTIGVELAADPSLLLLDEPTSGLDSKGAVKVMTAVKAVAMQGKSVICTIHQPSQQLFAMFSHLMLLKKGGQLVYFGPVHSEDEGANDFGSVLPYFEDLGVTCPPHKNPADFILDVSNGLADGSENLDTPAAFKESSLHEHLMTTLDEGVFSDSVPVRKHTHQYASNIFVTIYALILRNFMTSWRLFLAVRLNMLVFFGLGLILGFTYFQIDYDQSGTIARASLLYYALIVTNLITVPLMGMIIFERAIYYRERASRTYRSLAYLLALFISNFPFLLTYTLLFSVPIYWLVGFQREADKFFIYLLIVILSLLLNQSFLALLGALAPNLVVGLTMMATTLSAFAIFNGFLIPRQNIPNYWIWAHYIDPTTYPLEALLVNEFTGGVDLYCGSGEAVAVPTNDGGTYYYCPLSTGDAFLASFDYSPDNLWRNVGIMFGMWGAFVVITAMVLAWWKQIKR